MAVFLVVGSVHVFRVTGCSSGQFWSFKWHCLLYWEVLRLSDALFVVVGIVELFRGSVCCSGQCSYYQSPWL